MMQEDGEQIGRFKVRGLMRELELLANNLDHIPTNKRRLSGLTFRTS